MADEETPTPWEEGFAKGPTSVITIRCVKNGHHERPTYNRNEEGGGECSACCYDEGYQRGQEAGRGESAVEALEARAETLAAERARADKAEADFLAEQAESHRLAVEAAQQRRRADGLVMALETERGLFHALSEDFTRLAAQLEAARAELRVATTDAPDGAGK